MLALVRSRNWMIGAITAWAIACGARSELEVISGASGGSVAEGGEGGEGGVGGVGGDGGVGGEGGQGGMPPECEPGALLVYLVSSTNQLYSYRPSDGALAIKGTLACDSSGPTPFSMGVDRTGLAFVLYNDGNLYRVKTSDASCEETDFMPNQFGFTTFGMGFARNVEAEVDELFVTEISFGAGSSKGLARIDTETLELLPVGSYQSALGDVMEMTSSSDGNLYGYALDDGGGGWVLQIDKTTAAFVDQTFLPVGTQSSALAFAFWNDDFYIFTTAGAGTDVTRYRPADGTVAVIQHINDVIVGAGVSTCDPR